MAISGITQTEGRDHILTWREPPHLPRDPQKARIGSQRVNPGAASCTPFWRADILNPDKNKTAPVDQIGYVVHAHYWIVFLDSGWFKAI